MAEIERRAQSYGTPLRWADPWPTDYLIAMRAATYAFTIGKGREFTLQAFRNAFQHGRDTSIAANVLDTGERVGIDVSDSSPLPEVSVGSAQLLLNLYRSTSHLMATASRPANAIRSAGHAT